MFKSIADDHKATQQQRKAEMRELETKIVEKSVPAFSDAIFSELNSGSEQIVVNQREIDRKCKAVRDEWKKFNDELLKWTGLINDLDRAVKEVGDVRSWSIGIQNDIQAVVEQLGAKSTNT